MKTRDDIEYLKSNWRGDPCWDIELTEGFEEHEQELLAYRLEQEGIWEEREQERLIRKSNRLDCSIPLVRCIESLEYKIRELQGRLDNE